MKGELAGEVATQTHKLHSPMTQLLPMKCILPLPSPQSDSCQELTYHEGGGGSQELTHHRVAKNLEGGTHQLAPLTKNNTLKSDERFQ